MGRSAPRKPARPRRVEVGVFNVDDGGHGESDRVHRIERGDTTPRPSLFSFFFFTLMSTRTQSTRVLAGGGCGGWPRRARWRSL